MQIQSLEMNVKSVCMCVCVCVCMYVCMYVCMCMYVYVCVCMYVYVHNYVCVCMKTWSLPSLPPSSSPSPPSHHAQAVRSGCHEQHLTECDKETRHCSGTAGGLHQHLRVLYPEGGRRGGEGEGRGEVGVGV